MGDTSENSLEWALKNGELDVIKEVVGKVRAIFAGLRPEKTPAFLQSLIITFIRVACCYCDAALDDVVGYQGISSPL